MNRSPLVCPPVPPTRAMPRPARWASRSHWWGSSGASVATTTMIEPEPGGGASAAPRPRRTGSGPRCRDRLADPHAIDAQPVALAVVRLDEHADRVAADVAASMTRDAVPMPPLNSWQTIPVPPPTAPSSTGPPGAAASAACRCSAVTWKPLMSLSRPSNVSPTTGSDQRGVGRIASTDAATSASRTTPTLWVLVIATGVVSSPDSRTHSRPVSSPLPLSRWQPAKTGSRQSAAAARADDGHAGPDRALADDERPVAADERRVADGHAGDVGDGVERAGRPQPDPDPEVSCSHRRTVAGRRVRRGVDVPGALTAAAARRIIRGVIPVGPNLPGSPTAPLRLRRLPDRIASGAAIDAAEAFRDLPGPRPARERPARPQRALDLPDRRPGRRARGAGRRPGPVRRRPPPRGPAGPDAGRPGRRAAVPRRARRVPRLRPRARPRAPALDRGRRPGPAAAPPRAPRLGRRLGPPDRPRLARRPGARRRRSPARPPPRRRPRAADHPAARGPGTLADATAPPTRAPLDAPTGEACRFRSSLSRAAYEAGVERVRDHIARGDIYQANLTRRLETPFDGDPWALYRRLRTGDPSLFSAYLDLGAVAGDRPAAGPPVRLAGAVPVARRGRRRRHATRSRARGRAAATAPRTARSPASCWPAPRTAPRT